mgnify:CR=1 FL=1
MLPLYIAVPMCLFTAIRWIDGFMKAICDIYGAVNYFFG